MHVTGLSFLSSLYCVIRSILYEPLRLNHIK